ncbi:Uu.00g036620.m01.CDS01 [Anthostomella pinea]|uniref:Uu.00g036620.m01.CDS01 n=1 Tax=Anthostomella pinea TaxID=933095 RepID=A0AAI8V9G8_9PEZI|nr:Uu.00g036620.m01.CDS01 [Anthostomella pinea]
MPLPASATPYRVFRLTVAARTIDASSDTIACRNHRSSRIGSIAISSTTGQSNRYSPYSLASLVRYPASMMTVWHSSTKIRRSRPRARSPSAYAVPPAGARPAPSA